VIRLTVSPAYEREIAMSDRRLTWPGATAAAALLATAGIAAQTTSPAAPARNPRAAVNKAAPPRLPDGRPDLQGVWDFRTLTPLERPTTLEGKEVLSDQEAATLEESAIKSRVDRPPRDGDPGTYNQFWFDFGTKVVSDKRTSLIVDPPDGRLPALTESGKKRAAEQAERLRRPATGPEDRPLWERCILGFNSGPPIIPNGYNNNLRLLQTASQVVILTEMVHDARIVPLDGRSHHGMRQWMGDSRGRWEGDTLIIDTVGFTDAGTGTIGLRPTADGNLHLTERLTRLDADTLLYQFTMDDPTVWSKPWTAAVEMTRSREDMYEYACHEGNHGLLGILAGARADERGK
jgi:hypothetical protein